jgi:NADH-quinone oxidoreductase subunit I
MYCGICVEVCPFDALFWSPDFEYAEYDIVEMTHEKERLEEWTYKVLPPPALEEGAEAPASVDVAAAVDAGTPASLAESSTPRGAPAGYAPPASAQPPAPPPATPAAESQPPSVAGAPPTPAAEAAAPAADAASAPAAPAGHVEVEPDQETYDRVLQEEVAKGTDRRVAEGRAKAAAVRAARKKAEG